jgi:hypothetical protein
MVALYFYPFNIFLTSCTGVSHNLKTNRSYCCRQLYRCLNLNQQHMRSLLLPVALFFSFALQAQGPNVLLKLQVTDMAKKPLTTTVSFIQKNTGKRLNFITDASGRADCSVPANSKYSITAAGSEDSYDYNIDDFGGETLPLELQFEAVAKGSFATESNALLSLRVFNNPGVGAYSVKSAGGFQSPARIENDSSYVQLPVAQSYELALPGVSIANNRIPISNSPYQIVYATLYFHSDKKAELFTIDTASTILHLVYNNLTGKAVTGEKMLVKSNLTGQQYIATTGANGSALLVVPKNDRYSVSLKYYEDYAGFDTREKASFISNSVTVFYPSSAEQEKRAMKAAKELAARDAAYALHKKTQEQPMTALSAKLKTTTAATAAGLARNPAYFVETKNEVGAVLYRNRKKWPAKTIVTDVTGSMYPYVEQVAGWHFLEAMNKEKSAYVFFNDGDAKMDSEKVIGKTGGLYTSFANTPDSLLRTMYTAMSNGGGGDGPENDIEALEKGQSINTEVNELILVADNYSPVKDIELLSRIKKPVRVILCGFDQVINPDCLRIAYETKGSIHTIEEDIDRLAELHDGEKITLFGTTYQLVKGRFFLLEMKML